MQHYELGDLVIAQHNRSIFRIEAGDEHTPASITVKDYKEMGISLNALQERILLLVSEHDALQQRIETLEERMATTERNLDAFASCVCVAGEEGID